MSIVKTKIQKDIINDFGNKIDDMLEVVERDGNRHAGARLGLLKAKENIDALCKEIDDDLESGKLAEVSQDLLPLAEYVKRWILRSGGVCDNLATAAEVNVIKAEGKIAATKAILDMAKKIHDKADTKIKKYEENLESVEISEEEELSKEMLAERPDASTLSPAADIAARKKEAKKDKQKKSTEVKSVKE